MKLKDFLKKYRIDHDLTQDMLADKIGCTQALVSALENEKPTSLTATTIRKIAKATDVTDIEIAGMYYDNKQ